MAVVQRELTDDPVEDTNLTEEQIVAIAETARAAYLETVVVKFCDKNNLGVEVVVAARVDQHVASTVVIEVTFRSKEDATKFKLNWGDDAP